MAVHRDTPIRAHNVGAVYCNHPACLELHRLRRDAIRRHKWDRVNHIDRHLILCPDQPKDDRT